MIIPRALWLVDLIYSFENTGGLETIGVVTVSDNILPNVVKDFDHLYDERFELTRVTKVTFADDIGERYKIETIFKGYPRLNRLCDEVRERIWVRATCDGNIETRSIKEKSDV